MEYYTREFAQYFGYAAILVAAMIIMGLIPGIPPDVPVFLISILGAGLVFLSLQQGSDPKLEDLPSGPTEDLPRNWRMFIFGSSTFACSWAFLLLVVY
ncbi:MAG: hypothetical protein ABEI06_05510 [Halobacteriaceae archaeon]